MIKDIQKRWSNFVLSEELCMKFTKDGKTVFGSIMNYLGEYKKFLEVVEIYFKDVKHVFEYYLPETETSHVEFTVQTCEGINRVSIYVGFGEKYKKIGIGIDYFK